jgi:hypothetical protein
VLQRLLARELRPTLPCLELDRSREHKALTPTDPTNFKAFRAIRGQLGDEVIYLAVVQDWPTVVLRSRQQLGISVEDQPGIGFANVKQDIRWNNVAATKFLLLYMQSDHPLENDVGELRGLDVWVHCVQDDPAAVVINRLRVEPVIVNAPLHQPL